MPVPTMNRSIRFEPYTLFPDESLGLAFNEWEKGGPEGDGGPLRVPLLISRAP